MVKGREGLALLRDCLKIANYYVRYRDLSDILRRNLLTQACKSSRDNSWQTDIEKWKNTKTHLEDCFGVKTDKGIVGPKLRQLDLIRRIEGDRLDPESKESKDREIAEKDFSERWQRYLEVYSSRPDTNFFLQSVVFEPKLKPSPKPTDSLIDSFLNDSKRVKPSNPPAIAKHVQR